MARSGAAAASSGSSATPTACASSLTGPAATAVKPRARCGGCGPAVVIGADGARSAVAQPGRARAEKVAYVFAYHEIMRRPTAAGRLRPHALRRVSTAAAVARLLRLGVPARRDAEHRHRQRRQGLLAARRGGHAAPTPACRRRTLRREGAPMPMKPLKRWDNGRDVVLAGDAAGVVAPASGEGIYYAMAGGRLAAEAATGFLRTGSRQRCLGWRASASCASMAGVLGAGHHAALLVPATSAASASSASARTRTCSS
jgi:hypothetical protein